MQDVNYTTDLEWFEDVQLSRVEYFGNEHSAANVQNTVLLE